MLELEAIWSKSWISVSGFTVFLAFWICLRDLPLDLNLVLSDSFLASNFSACNIWAQLSSPDDDDSETLDFDSYKLIMKSLLSIPPLTKFDSF